MMIMVTQVICLQSYFLLWI